MAILVNDRQQNSAYKPTQKMFLENCFVIYGISEIFRTDIITGFKGEGFRDFSQKIKRNIFHRLSCIQVSTKLVKITIQTLNGTLLVKMGNGLCLEGNVNCVL